MLVSVIVPTYNRAALLMQCHASIVAQAHRPLEMIIADDASTDDTEAVVAALPKADGVCVRYLKLAQNGGVSKARNTAIRAAGGEFIALLDSDDVWLPHHLDRLLSALKAAGADIAFSKAEIRTSPDAGPSGREHGLNDYEQRHFASCLYFYNPVLPSATVARRDLFERIGFFDETPDIQHAEDWDFVLRAASAGLKFEYVPEVTACYIVPCRSTGTKYQMMLERSIRCLEKNGAYPLTPASHRLVSVGYYKLQLAAVYLEQQPGHARRIFEDVWQSGHKQPCLALTSATGQLFAFSPWLCRRLLPYLLRWVRAKQRRLRGYADCWD